MRLIVTRPAGQEQELIARLEELGHDVVHCPLIRIEPLSDEPIDVASYDWVIVTSPNGARELQRRASGPMPRVGAIGRATAAAMGQADLIASVSTQEGLAAELPRPAGRVLVAAAAGARRYLVDVLGAEFVALYRTHAIRPDPLPTGDLCLLASASAARAFGVLETGIPALTIGPETTLAAREAGVLVLAEASTHDLEGLVAGVVLLSRSR